MPADLWSERYADDDVGADRRGGRVASRVTRPHTTTQKRTAPAALETMPVPWTGFEVFAAFFVIVIAIPQLVIQLLSSSDFFLHIYGEDFRHRDTEAATVQMLWTNLVALPLQLGAVLAARQWMYREWRPKPNSSVAP